MSFNSLQYLWFLPLVFCLYWFVFKPLRWQNLLVVAASYVFYGWWDWRFLLLIAFTSMCSYASGLLIEKQKSRGEKRKAYWVSAANILVNLLILGIFKSARNAESASRLRIFSTQRPSRISMTSFRRDNKARHEVGMTSLIRIIHVLFTE